MSRAKGKAWKLERASVHGKRATRPRSNKFSKSDREEKPVPHTRSKVWVGGYTRSDGTTVRGHFRVMH
jgi:hypothetical protein